ncbi:MAG: signal peptide peptidase SppA [Steroidobacteraceae bacterium]
MWRGLDGLRRILHLVLLLLIFGFIVGALRGNVPYVPGKTALLVQPRGTIVEQLDGDPIRRAFDEARGEGQSQTLLWDLTETIRYAANDRRVRLLVLDLDYLDGAGQPTLAEIAAALQEFRATGKQVIARATSYTQARYYLAAQADEIHMDPMGEVLLEGYERYRMYYKGLLDKLAVDVHLFRVGAWKSAAEDLVRKDMSPEDRAESQAYLDALWGGYRQAVAAARGLDPQAIDDYANGYIEALRQHRGDTAEVAKAAGLITDLTSESEFNAHVAELMGEEEQAAEFPAVEFADYLRVRHAEEGLHGKGSRRVGVVVASGEILDGEQPPGTVGGVTTGELLRRARDNENIAAVVLRVDSPGGSVFASEQIYREVKALKEAGKPVVVSMGDVAASGGYYIAAPADRIIAHPMTITGSIGIFAALPVVDRTLGKLGVTVDGVGTTALSGKLRVDRPMDPMLRDYVQLTIERGYEQFLDHVAQGRGSTRDEVHQVAQGRVWIGTDALENKLVDSLGTYADAVREAAQLANLPEGYDVQRVEQDLSWAEQLALRLRVGAARLSGRILGPTLSALHSPLESLAGLPERPVAELQRLRRLLDSRGALAYCFCRAQ